MKSTFWTGAAALGVVAGIAACTEIGLQAGADGDETAGGGACGAAAFQDLVGTSIGTLDASTLPENRRVIFPGMSVTQDYVPERLNVAVGSGDEIERVYCG